MAQGLHVDPGEGVGMPQFCGACGEGSPEYTEDGKKRRWRLKLDPCCAEGCGIPICTLETCRRECPECKETFCARNPCAQKHLDVHIEEQHRLIRDGIRTVVRARNFILRLQRDLDPVEVPGSPGSPDRATIDSMIEAALDNQFDGGDSSAASAS